MSAFFVFFSFLILKGKILLKVNACTFACNSGLLQLYNVLNWFIFLKFFYQSDFKSNETKSKNMLVYKSGSLSYFSLLLFFYFCHYRLPDKSYSAAFVFFFTTRKKPFHIVGYPVILRTKLKLIYFQYVCFYDT